MVDNCQPVLPIIGTRPPAATRAAKWFLENFPGDVIYALKANSAPQVVSALMGAGISHIDVASLSEIKNAHGFGAGEIHYMNPVKSRHSVGAAYFDFGVRSFSIDHDDELEKIVKETNGAKDLKLFVRLACDGHLSRIPLDRKYGVAGSKAVELLIKTRQVAHEIGVTFHVGSQALNPDAFTSAMVDADRVILQSGVLLDVLDVGGGFPSAYPGLMPPSMDLFVSCIIRQFERMTLGEHCRLMCEPGRALVAEAESVIVQVDARRGQELYISDGAFGMMYDATHADFRFPARRVGGTRASASGLVRYSLWGPSCDSIDFMKGPFMLPEDIEEGQYIEIGQLGAYGRSLSSSFCGFGAYREVNLQDPPMLSMYQETMNAQTDIILGNSTA